jgi:hypothetical protein
LVCCCKLLVGAAAAGMLVGCCRTNNLCYGSCSFDRDCGSWKIGGLKRVMTPRAAAAGLCICCTCSNWPCRCDIAL